MMEESLNVETLIKNIVQDIPLALHVYHLEDTDSGCG